MPLCSPLKLIWKIGFESDIQATGRDKYFHARVLDSTQPTLILNDDQADDGKAGSQAHKQGIHAALNVSEEPESDRTSPFVVS